MIESDDQRLPPVRAQARDEVTPLAEHVYEVENMKDNLWRGRQMSMASEPEHSRTLLKLENHIMNSYLLQRKPLKRNHETSYC